MTVALYCGDCREVLPTLPEGSVQCVVTSPPYWGLRDYGVSGQLGLESTFEEYLAGMVAVFREVRRVLCDAGTCWVNMGDAFAAKQLIGQPWRLAFALQAAGWILRADIIWSKPNPIPEAVTDRPMRAHEYVFLLTKTRRYFYDSDAVREPHAEPWRGNGERDGGRARETDGRARRAFTVCSRAYNALGRHLRSVWTIQSERCAGAHFATFPKVLAGRCILAGSRVGDTVLDPFGGTGTVGAVAEQYGRHSVLIELSPTYVAMAAERTAQRGLFAQSAAEA